MFIFSNHLKRDHSNEYASYFASDKTAPAQQPGHLFDQTIANRKFARMVGQSTISFRQATSPEFKEFTEYLNSEYHHPSRQTLIKAIRNEAEQLIPVLKALLSKAPIVSFFKKNYKFFLV